MLNTVLVTNDDGIEAEGIRYLYDIARGLARQVVVIAPTQDCSGRGQALSLHSPLRVKQVKANHYAVTGSPADCVLLGLNELIDGPVDLVLSGINRGANVGDAVPFSGTLGAASVASQFGVAAAGLSQAFKDPRHIHWQSAQQLAAPLLTHLLSIDWSVTPCLNINFPAVSIHRIQGIRWCEGSRGSIRRVRVDARTDPRQRQYYWLDFEHDYKNVQAPQSDVATLRSRHVAVQSLNQVNPVASGTAIMPNLLNAIAESPYE